MLKKTDPDIIKGFLEDSSNLSGGYADGVYLPQSEAEIAEAAAECNAKKTPLTISAGQTGTTGGCIPFGGWILSTQKLNKIININKQQKIAIVQPGVTLEELEKAAAREGLFYPPDPTEKTATLGGNVATNASGGRCYRFGATRSWVRRLRVVLTDGRTLDLKRLSESPKPALKSSAGYYHQPGMEQLDLFIGSEGTLGIVSEIEVLLLPVMKQTLDLVAFFPTEELAVDFVAAAKAVKEPTINFFEFFDENTLKMLKPDYPKIPAKVKAAIYIEQENPDLDFWPPLLEKFQSSLDNSWIGLEPAQKEELFKFRHAIPEHINELFKQYHQVKLATDIAVPENKFREMFNFYNSSLVPNSQSLFYIKFGHIGDNHLHVNLLARSDAELKLAKELVMKFVAKAVALGGTVSAEHGIGKIKKPYLEKMYDPAGIREMLAIKKRYDPNLILGENNLFDA